MSDYETVAQAIRFIQTNRQQQPTLQAIAAHVNLSPFHFQRLFSRWAGISPKRFLQALTLADAKIILSQAISNESASHSLGLSSSSRLYDHFVQLNAVTPAEFKLQGEGLEIGYGLHDSPYGKVFIAHTEKGICQLQFVDSQTQAELLQQLQAEWPKASLKKNIASTKSFCKAIFYGAKNDKPLSLWVKGTNFQINVWQALLKLPQGQLATYSSIAKAVNQPKAYRAVGTAIGKNPIAFLIPCHRVIQQSGELGGYRWDVARKQAILAKELASSQ